MKSVNNERQGGVHVFEQLDYRTVQCVEFQRQSFYYTTIRN